MTKKIITNSWHALNKRERRWMALLAAGDVIITLLDIAVLALLLLAVNAYIQPQNTINWSFVNQWFGTQNILPGLTLLLLLFISKNMAAYFLFKARYHFVYNVAARISANNMLQYLEGNYLDHVSTDSSVNIRRISQQPIEFSHYILAGILQMFSESIMILLAVAAIIIFDATLFLLLCAVLLPPLVLLFFYTRKRVGMVKDNIKSSSEKALQHLKEALAGYVESNVYDTHDFFADRYSRKQQTLNKYLADLQSVQILPNRLMEIFAVLGLLSLIAFNELARGTSLIPIVTIGAFLAAAYKIIPGLVKLLNINSQLRAYAFTAEELAVDTKPTVAGVPAQLHIDSVCFRQVSFQYQQRQVLHNFNFDINKGEFAGLSGLSGKGKSTLFNLLLGFIDPNDGEILINNSPASTQARQRQWKNISYVKQQPFLLHDTILTNITLNGNHDEQRLQRSINASGLDGLISQLPKGLHTVIAENGKDISGGQRQRIALARAFYKDADLLLLDEPFNELDEAAEESILQHLQLLSRQGKLVMLVTHNKKSLSYCTKTISLDAY